MYDVLIVGGGPAGLSCALVLGRSGRRVLVCDDTTARNLRTPNVNGYLGLVDASPAELRALGRWQLEQHGNVELCDQHVLSLERLSSGFSALLQDGARRFSTKAVLATGLSDELPAWPGIAEYYGRGVYTCPYCDAWEHRHQPIAVYGPSASAYRFALHITAWSAWVTLCSDGPSDLPESARRELERRHVVLREEPVASLQGSEGRLCGLEFASGAHLECSALFLATPQHQRSSLALELGCEVDEKGFIKTDRRSCTNIAGLFVAGDADTYVGTQLAIVAAADGARAGQVIDQELFKEQMQEALSLVPEQ